MFQKRLIYDEEAFTASKDLENLTPGRYIHALNVAYTGEMTAAAKVLPATFADLLNPLEIRLFGSPVIYIRGSDLWALNLLAFGNNPLTMEPAAATDSIVRIFGLKVPIQQPARGAGELTIKANRVAVSGVDTETLTVAEISSDTVLKPAYYHFVEIAYTLAAATGYGNFIDLPQPGDLHGILFWSNTIPTQTASNESVKKVMVVIDGARAYESTWDEMKADSKTGSGHDTGDSPADTSFIDNYAYLDFSDDPIPKASTVRLDIFAGTASDPIRVIPVYLVAP